jgi:hypothetical protein
MRAQPMRPSSAQVVVTSAISAANQYTPWSASGVPAVPSARHSPGQRGGSAVGPHLWGSWPSVLQRRQWRQRGATGANAPAGVV